MEFYADDYFPWVSRPCRVKDDQIKTLGDVSQPYNVMDYNGHPDNKPALYSIFASVDENQLKEIEKFCGQFGLLGLNRTTLYRDKGETSDSHEQVENIRIEILRMRAILNALHALGAGNDNLLSNKIFELIRMEHGDCDDDLIEDVAEYVSRTSDRKMDGLSLISDFLTKYLQDIHPGLVLDYERGILIQGWSINSLIAAIYFMLFAEISKGNYVKPCDNETCGRFFPTSVERMGTKYCSQKCARSQASREFRRRQRKLQSEQIPNKNEGGF